MLVIQSLAQPLCASSAKAQQQQHCQDQVPRMLAHQTDKQADVETLLPEAKPGRHHTLASLYLSLWLPTLHLSDIPINPALAAPFCPYSPPAALAAPPSHPLTSSEGSCCRRRSRMPSVTTSTRVDALTWNTHKGNKQQHRNVMTKKPQGQQQCLWGAALSACQGFALYRCGEHLMARLRA